MSFKDRIKEALGLDKVAGVHLAMAVIISVIITAVIFTQVGVGQGAYNTEQAQQAQSIATQGSEIASNDDDISDLQDDFRTMGEQYSELVEDMGLQSGNITAWQTRLTDAAGDITGLGRTLGALNATVGNVTTNVTVMQSLLATFNVSLADNLTAILSLGFNLTALGSDIEINAGNITDLKGDVATLAGTVGSHSGYLDLLDDDVEALAGNITAMQGELETIGSPPEAYLSGNLTSGNLTIHAEASEAGDYTADVHLVFTPTIGVGNATTYSEAVANWTATVNWAVADAKLYIPVASYNGTTWAISQVWWNVGAFELAADTDIAVLFGGLADMPSFAYVEIYPALVGG